MRKILTYRLGEIEPYINWLYFDHAWGLKGNVQRERDALRADAKALLQELAPSIHTHAIFALYDANSDGDDLIVGDMRIPMLRQQGTTGVNLCLADFIRPFSAGIKDRIGVFATTVDAAMETSFRQDDYRHMLAQTLADRLAEATAERMHEQVRTIYWGYAPNEQLTIRQLHREEYQGIRPAVGYPSLPDVSVNFMIADLLQVDQIGIQLTESGMMIPHASVSGFMFAHPQSRYFHVGIIGEDQLQDYARRRHIPVEALRRFLSTHG